MTNERRAEYWCTPLDGSNQYKRKGVIAITVSAT